jgi:hypothetical protein
MNSPDDPVPDTCAKALEHCEVKEEKPKKPWGEDKGLMKFLTLRTQYGKTLPLVLCGHGSLALTPQGQA